MSEIKTWQASYNEDFQKNGHDCSAQWEHVAREITELRAALAKAQRDTVLMDWLADMDNDIGQVLLPTASVRRNPGSMRDAIEDAMNGGTQ